MPGFCIEMVITSVINFHSMYFNFVLFNYCLIVGCVPYYDLLGLIIGFDPDPLIRYKLHR